MKAAPCKLTSISEHSIGKPTSAIAENRFDSHNLQIVAQEKALNQAVYKLFDLSTEEVGLLDGI